MLVAALFVGGCASKSVELVSEPGGLEVQTIGGETLGTTPVVLREEALEKAMSNDGLLSVRFVGAGYLPQTLLVEVRGNDTYRIQPVKLDELFFRKYILRDFSGEHNVMVRDMLNIQGLIRNRKFDDAEKALVTFQERFPTIAMAYVMMANLSLIRGDRVLARRYLIQAQALDPQDAIVARMLGTTVDVRNAADKPGDIGGETSAAMPGQAGMSLGAGGKPALADSASLTNPGTTTLTPPAASDMKPAEMPLALEDTPANGPAPSAGAKKPAPAKKPAAAPRRARGGNK